LILKKSNELLNESIFWQKHESHNRYFYAYNDGELLLLRLNNFPDEPLITLIRRLDIVDMEEVPMNWVVPF